MDKRFFFPSGVAKDAAQVFDLVEQVWDSSHNFLIADVRLAKECLVPVHPVIKHLVNEPFAPLLRSNDESGMQIRLDCCRNVLWKLRDRTFWEHVIIRNHTTDSSESKPAQKAHAMGKGIEDAGKGVSLSQEQRKLWVQDAIG